jgi:hypothetical protein
LFVNIYCEIIISCFQISYPKEKSLVEKDGKGLEQFNGVVETPAGVVPQHLHEQEGGEEGTSTTTQTKANSQQRE